MTEVWLDPVTQFTELYQQTHSKVHNYIYQRAPSEADDLTQETYFRAFRARFTYVPKSHPGAWIITIAHHCTVSWLRSKKSSEQELQDIHTAQPSRGFEEAEVRDYLQSITASLSYKTAEVLKLYYLDELRLSEIADRLNIPRMTVSSRKRRGLNQMREQAGQNGY